MGYFIFLLLPIFCFAKKVDKPIFYEDRVQAVFDSLDPSSLKELFAFYTLYKDTALAEIAFDKAWYLMNLHRPFPLEIYKNFQLPQVSLEAIITLTTTGSTTSLPELSLSELKVINSIGEYLGNRGLKGHQIWDYKEVIQLSPEQIDVARAILLHEFDPTKEEEKKKLLLYEGSLDLMALQILAKLPFNPSHEQKLEAITAFIFHEMGYRFPPHSMWTSDVDLFTFLPAVMDSRHGVCLGVSILYLSLAQRLQLPLEIITPPGHIYLSYITPTDRINIETTARGIHIPEEHYLTVNTKSLPRRNLKEVVGMHFFNHAGTAWQVGNHKKSKELYLIAKEYIDDDPLIDTFLAIQHLCLGEKEIGEKLFERVARSPDPHSIHQNSMVEDYLKGMVDIEGLQAIFMHVDENRESILAKQRRLKETVKKNPRFREGLFHLAITWLQLGRTKEALETLILYHEIDIYNPIIEYYITLLSIKRLQYHKAWEHYFILDKILSCQHHQPKTLRDLHDNLNQIYPYRPYQL
jgi:tetratricopeptide (TPR) repeat protein